MADVTTLSAKADNDPDQVAAFGRDEDDQIRVVDAPDRYAVLLNALAKGWSGTLHHEIQRLIPSDDLYLTDNFQQAERTIDLLLERDYPVVFTGGGDGTVMFLVNALERRIREGRLDRSDAPLVGVLRMGSGNAIAAYLGTESATDKLRALRAGAPLAVYSLDMLTSDDEMFPFAGIGWDAEVLNDYEDFKEMVQGTAFEEYATGIPGYVASVFTRTIPRVLTRNSVHVTVENRGERAFKIDQRGEIQEEYGEGAILYDGPVQTCATASVPYWGYKIRMFPYATLRRGYCMLRCFDGSVWSVLRRLPSMWKGRLPPGTSADFLYSHVRVETSDRPMPYQKTGEGAGHCQSVDWRVADHPIRLAAPLH